MIYTAIVDWFWLWLVLLLLIAAVIRLLLGSKRTAGAGRIGTHIVIGLAVLVGALTIAYFIWVSGFEF